MDNRTTPQGVVLEYQTPNSRDGSTLRSDVGKKAPRSLTRVVVLSQVFYPDSQSSSQLLTDLLRNIRTDDLRITVVAGRRGLAGTPPWPRFELWNGIEVRRTGVSLDYKRSLFLRAIHYLAFLAGAVVQLWWLRKSDLVVALSNPPLNQILVWLLSKFFVARYQLLLHDIYPEGLVAVGRMRDGILARAWRFLNRKALRSAEGVLVLGRDMGRLLERAYGVDSKKIHYVPNWSLIEPSKPNRPEDTALYRRLGLAGKFIVQYSGNMGLWHDIDGIISAAAALRGKTDIHFLMIGDGIRRARAEELSRRLGLTNVTWLPFQPLDHLQDSLCCCHVALISQRAGLSGVAVPCKLYGILGAGRPVIAMVPRGSEIDLVLQEEGCGITVATDDQEGLAKAIQKLQADPALWDAMCWNSYEACRQKYIVSVAAARVTDLWSCVRNGY